MAKDIANDLEQSLFETVTTSDLSELVVDAADALAGLPIASTIGKIIRGYGSLSDYYFREKIVRLLRELGEVPTEERNQQLSKLLDDPGERDRFGKQLLLLLGRLDDSRKASIMGRLSVALLREKVSLLEFWRMNRAVEALSLDEEWPILQVIEDYKSAHYRDGKYEESWRHNGVLLEMVNEKLSIGISDGDLRSVVIRINQTGLFGCLGWRDGPAHDCDLAPWYFKLKPHMKW